MTKAQRLEWLRDRQSGIGGSDAGAILGVSKFKSPLDVYLEKVGDVRELDNAPIRRGRRLEPVALAMYEEIAERKVYPAVSMMRHPEFPMLFVNLDGTTTRLLDMGEQGGSLEVKAPGLRAFQALRNEGMGQSYYLQVQHGLGITGMPFGAFAAYSAERDEMLHYDVDPDVELIRKSQLILVEWWERHVVRRVPPDESSVAMELPKDAQIPTGEVTKIVTPAFLEQVARFWDARELREMAEALEEQEKGRLIEAMGAAQVVETADSRFIHRFAKGRTTFDRKALEALQPLDPEKVRAVIESSMHDHEGASPAVARKLFDQMVPDMLLDLSRCEKIGNPSQPFKPYRLRLGGSNE